MRLRDVELEELEPAVELGDEAVDVRAVRGEQLHLDLRLGQVRPDQRRLAAGLLVLPRAAHEDRDVDLGCRAAWRELVGEATGSRNLWLSNVSTSLTFWCRSNWFSAHCAPFGRRRSTTSVLPTLAVGFGLVVALLRPLTREADVRNPARIGEAAVRVGDDRQRRDRREVRRLGRSGERLRDTGVRDANHAGLAVQHPRLRGYRFDDVVPIEALQRLEEVERAARATGAADVHADGRVPEELRDLRAGLRVAGMPRVVAGVLDDGRERTRTPPGSVTWR